MVDFIFIFPRAGRSVPDQAVGITVPALAAWPAFEPFPVWWPAGELLAAVGAGAVYSLPVSSGGVFHNILSFGSVGLFTLNLKRLS